jgi:hypothetical protein
MVLSGGYCEASGKTPDPPLMSSYLALRRSHTFRCTEFGLLVGGYQFSSPLSGLWLSPLFNGVFGQPSIGVS